MKQGYTLTTDTINAAFSPVENLTDGQKEKIRAVETGFAQTAKVVNDIVPPGPAKTTILNGLLDGKFKAVHAVTHGSDTWGFASARASMGGNELGAPAVGNS